jgi:N-acetylmuramoyl-L-alanine amidase
MQTRRKGKGLLSPIRRQALLVGGRLMLAVAGTALLAAALIVVRLMAAQEGQPPTGSGDPAAAGDAAAASDSALLAAALPPDAPRVGIVAGHSGYDPGATCPDGLTEADVNLAVAQEVQGLLTRKGYRVDLLQEFDERLAGYRAEALISIHADSCEVPGATGFKVARVTDSAIPQAEDSLVNCLYQAYEATTGLPRHDSSVTDNMTNYHAFREIDKSTPGAIIEVGFLLDDRDLLTQRPKLVARGIAAGALCFLEEK